MQLTGIVRQTPAGVDESHLNTDNNYRSCGIEGTGLRPCQ